MGSSSAMEALQQRYVSILRAGAIDEPVRYRFVHELGHGRQGSVQLGLRQGARGCVTERAIKLYTPDLYRSADEYWEDMGRIARQISVLQRLQSMHLVTRHSYEETHGVGYVEMDVIDGIDLGRLLSPLFVRRVRERSREWESEYFMRTIFRLDHDEVRVQPGLVVYILRGVLRGLELLHAAGFLHYDVKPANIMIDRLGTVRVVDFGRAVRSGERLSFLLGAPRYMSPETHRREVCDARSDLFSLGLVGVELLSGRNTWSRGAESEKRLSDIKLNLRDRLHGILPADVVENEILFGILRRLVDPDPANRFAHAVDVDAGEDGLTQVTKQLVRGGLDSEYERDLALCLTKLIDVRTGRVEIPAEPARETTGVYPETAGSSASAMASS